MNGGSNPKRQVIEWEVVLGTSCALTDDVRGITPDKVPKFRDVAAIHHPTSLCGLVKPFSDFRTEFVCGAGSPVRPPVEGIQVGMWYIQQPGESCTQRRLSPRQGRVAGQTIRVSFTTRSLTFPVPARSTPVTAGRGQCLFTLVFYSRICVRSNVPLLPTIRILYLPDPSPISGFG